MSQSTSAGLPKRAWVSMRMLAGTAGGVGGAPEGLLELALDLVLPAGLGGDRRGGRHLARSHGRGREGLLHRHDVEDGLGLGGRELGRGEHRLRRTRPIRRSPPRSP